MSFDNFVASVRQLGLDPLASVVASVSDLYRMPQEDLNRIKKSRGQTR